MKRKTILNAIVDYDETLLPGILLLCRYIAQRLGVQIRDEELTSYTIWEKRFGITPQRIFELESEFYQTAEYRELKLDPVAMQVLVEIKSHPHCQWIDILTARHEDHMLYTQGHVKDFPGLFRKLFHVKNDKDGYRCKVDAYQEFFPQAFMFVDDAAKYTYKAALLYPHLHVFLLKKPWNAKAIKEMVDIPPNLYVVEDWHQISSIIMPILQL